MIKLIISVVFGCVVALMQFFGVSLLLSSETPPATGREFANYLNFVEPREPEPEKIIERHVPERPKPAIQPPAPKPMVSTPESRPSQPKLEVNAPEFSPGFSGSGAMVAAVAATETVVENASAMPLVRVEPQYPRKAALRGHEGFVTIRYVVAPDGGVENMEIIASKPRRLFDKAALNALRQWKFRPRKVDGKPVASEPREVTLEFKLHR